MMNLWAINQLIVSKSFTRSLYVVISKIILLRNHLRVLVVNKKGVRKVKKKLTGDSGYE